MFKYLFTLDKVWMDAFERSAVFLYHKRIPIILKSKLDKNSDNTGNDVQIKILDNLQKYRTHDECSKDANGKRVDSDEKNIRDRYYRNCLYSR